MRYLLTCFSLTLFSLVRANDTLTRAQVYSFNVGDTFDYRNSTFTYTDNNMGPPSDSFSFSRYVIQNIYSSSDSLTKYIARKQLYPAPVSFDTLILTTPQGYEVFLDTLQGWTASAPYDTIIVDSSELYMGRNTNYISLFHPVQYYYVTNQLFAQGLGLVLKTDYGGALSYHWGDSIMLIYYSGLSGTMGTPYYDFPTSISNISPDLSINIRPNPSHGCFWFNEINEGSTIEIFDLLGQKVYSVITDRSNYTIDLSTQPQGIYIYRVKYLNSIIGSGRIVVE